VELENLACTIQLLILISPFLYKFMCSVCLQIKLSGQWSNVSLVNVDLENLAYGDAESSQEAEGNSILLSNQLWAFSYKR
jgi:hypothetical protein